MCPATAALVGSLTSTMVSVFPECVKPRGTDDARILGCILVPPRRLTDDHKGLAIV